MATRPTDGSSAAKATGSIQVISRAVHVLRALAGAPDGLSLSQLAQRIGLPRSSVHRIVAALAVEDEPTDAVDILRRCREVIRVELAVRDFARREP